MFVFRQLPSDPSARIGALHDVTVADPRRPGRREAFRTRNIAEPLFGWDRHDKTPGIAAVGRIGLALARRAALGFFVPVLHADPFAVERPAHAQLHARPQFAEHGASGGPHLH